MKILISGASGFVGKHLTSELDKTDFEIFDRSKKKINELNSWVKYGKKDILIFLSGKTSISESWENPYETYNANTKALHIALEYCLKFKVKLIFFSSFIYKINEFGVYKETDETKPYNPYALSKISSENLVKFYVSNFNLDAVILRPFNIYGPGQKNSFIISHIFHQLQKGNTIHLKSTEPVRDYIFVKDIIKALILVIKKPFYGLKIYNLSTGKGTSVNELVELISKITKKKLYVKLLEENEKINVNKAVGDNSSFKKDYGWEPTFSLKKGIKICKDYYLKK